MVHLLALFDDGDRFHDPTCGSGGMLIESAYHYRDEQDGNYSKLTFTGQEINPEIYAIAKMNCSSTGSTATFSAATRWAIRSSRRMENSIPSTTYLRTSRSRRTGRRTPPGRPVGLVRLSQQAPTSRSRRLRIHHAYGRPVERDQHTISDWTRRFRGARIHRFEIYG